MPFGHPKIRAGLVIGEINLETKKIIPNLSNPISFTCLSSGQCCSKLDIPISDVDIQRLENQGFSINQIVSIQSPSIKLPKTEQSGIEKYYTMKKKAYTKSCRFLDDSKKCIIYTHRPIGCRIFPFSIKHISKNRVQVRIHPTNICSNIHISADPENYQILQVILKEYLADLKRKREYFLKYGNEI
ncbi:MAG: YkgJ family cysteine cluster protein [Candidatus Heimdallarchaeota archaeon]|nr:YkgJ family cysteine cluster protein [Candidatus Heimdallarchaeota archaeon]